MKVAVGTALAGVVFVNMRTLDFGIALGTWLSSCSAPPPDAAFGVILSQASFPEAMKDTSAAPFPKVPMHGAGSAELWR
jgi:hypothetical protein